MSELTLHLQATEEEIADFFKRHYSHTDSDVTEDQVNNVVIAHQGNAAWRNSLPVQDQLALSNVPATSAPGSLDVKNPPTGVIVVNPGTEQNQIPQQTTSDTTQQYQQQQQQQNNDPQGGSGSTPGNPTQ